MKYPPLRRGRALQRLRVTDLDHDSDARSDEPARLDLGFLLAAVLHVDDPRERLRRLRVVRAEVGELEKQIGRMIRSALLEIRETDPLATWAELGDLLGVTLQRAEQLSRASDD